MNDRFGARVDLAEHKRSLRGILEKFVNTPGLVSPEEWREACEKALTDAAAEEFRREEKEP